MARDWRIVFETLSHVQQLIHLAYRKDALDEDRIRADLLRQARRAYESELTIQAQRVGCPGRAGRLNNGPILSELNDLSTEWATSIVNTFNYDAAGAILNIGSETPSANRHVYAKRLVAWDEKREGWKAPQIAQYTEGAARALAQQHFVQQNGVIGIAMLLPKEAQCPVCRGWVARGEIPLRVAMNNPPPYHQNCPHFHQIDYSKIPSESCSVLWMGE